MNPDIPVARWVDPDTLSNDIGEPDFHYHLQRFIQDQLKSELDTSPFFYIPDKIYVYSSVVTTFHAPSDLCGSGGMRHERIHAATSWRRGKPRYDCVFINSDELEPGMRGLSIARSRLFFSVTVNHVKYPCALVNWYSLVGDSPDENTGMWVVEHNILDDGKLWTAVVHLDTILCLAHLLPIYRDKQAPRGAKYTDSLDTFHDFYVNKFADHHAFEIAF